jgi:hypothetical protein
MRRSISDLLTINSKGGAMDIMYMGLAVAFFAVTGALINFLVKLER